MSYISRYTSSIKSLIETKTKTTLATQVTKPAVQSPQPFQRQDVKRSNQHRASGQSPVVNVPPPTTKREWLGNNPGVVCFLLAMENDRMMRENNAQFNRIKELEDFNEQQEIRIKELQTKLDSQTTEISNYKSDIEKHIIKIKQLESELNEYKSKLGSEDQSLTGRLKETERNLQDREKEQTNWKNKYTTDKTNWDSEIRRLNDLLTQKQKELDDYKNNQGKNYEQLQLQLKQFETKIREYKSQISTYKSDIDHLNKLLLEKNQEIDIKQIKFNKLQIKK